MKRNLLIHSMALFAPITLPILEAVNAKVIAEIGAEHGGNSKMLYEWLKARGGRLISIDCSPSNDFLDWVVQAADVVQHVAKPSLEVLSELDVVDAWFVDGDHNWYTVYHELNAIREKARAQKKPLLIFLHDVGWPCARRDTYYSPDRIPADYRHPLTWEEGVTLDEAGVIKGGFRGNGVFAVALREGGPRNGVLTAVEDFVNEHAGEFGFGMVPAVFGLGVLYDVTHPCAKQIDALLAPYHNNSLLHALEVNRLDNYLKVIEMQDKSTNNVAAQTPQHDVAYVSAWEARAVGLANMLNDEADDPNIWERLSLQMPDDPNQLDEFIAYLDMLMAMPQEQDTIKLISLLAAVSLAKKGEMDLSNTLLEKLQASFPGCRLVFGAVNYNLGLANQV